MDKIKFTNQRVAELEKRVFALFDKIRELEKVISSLVASSSSTDTTAT